ETFSDVHCGFAAVTLTEGYLHSCHGGRNCRQRGHDPGNVTSSVISEVCQLTYFIRLPIARIYRSTHQTLGMCYLIVNTDGHKDQLRGQEKTHAAGNVECAR